MQLTLNFSGLVCAFGEPWHDGPHPKCEAFGAELERQFDAKVQGGIYDERGYTKADRQMQARRAREHRRPDGDGHEGTPPEKAAEGRSAVGAALKSQEGATLPKPETGSEPVDAHTNAVSEALAVIQGEG